MPDRGERIRCTARAKRLIADYKLGLFSLNLAFTAFTQPFARTLFATRVHLIERRKNLVPRCSCLYAHPFIVQSHDSSRYIFRSFLLRFREEKYSTQRRRRRRKKLTRCIILSNRRTFREKRGKEREKKKTKRNGSFAIFRE